MSENVSLATFTLLLNSQDKLLSQHSIDIKEINSQLAEIVLLVKQDISATKGMFEIHIVEYRKDREQIDIRFTNLFKRQDKIDKILLQTKSMWMVFKGLSWVAKFTVASVILALTSSFVKMAFFP